MAPPSERPASGFGRTPSYGRMDGSPAMSRSSSYGTFDRGGDRGDSAAQRGRSSQGPAEAVFPAWKPSERVQALNEEQIQDIRQRLNVTVEVEQGQPMAAAAVESFVDMVSGANTSCRP